jgi:hypothetical protein
MLKEVVDIGECVYRENDEPEYPEHAEGYELVRSTHSISLAVDIHHYQLVPPELHVAERDQQDVVNHEYHSCP